MLCNKSTLKRLAEGHFICPMRFPDEFADLEDYLKREQAQQWLQAIGYRLARLGDEGAYFMAHNDDTIELRNQTREELRRVRDLFDPAVTFLSLLRETYGRHASLLPGEALFLADIAKEIRGKTMLEKRLEGMQNIPGLRSSDDTIERVRKILGKLTSDGYLVEVNPTEAGFQVTGKIEHLYRMLELVHENATELADSQLVDELDLDQGDLLSEPSDDPNTKTDNAANDDHGDEDAP